MTEESWPTPGATPPHTTDMSRRTRAALASIHRKHVHRSPWPDWEGARVERYSEALRRDAASQWSSRAVNEHGSIQQFTAVSHALCSARVPLELHGGLARLITDEVRHAELCANLADVYWPRERIWRAPRLHWPEAPGVEGDAAPTELLLWAASAIMEACCFGETLSVPMLQAIAVVATDALAVAVTEQILLDEHLHARLGWESVRFIIEHLGDTAREHLQAHLPVHMAGFERSVCGDISPSELLDAPQLTLEPAEDPDAHPNLGTLSEREYAMIFYHTIEHTIFPELERLGLDPMEAWSRRSA